MYLLYSLGRKKADSEEHKTMETAADKSPEVESDYGGSTEDEQEAEPRQSDPKPLTQGHSSNFTQKLKFCYYVLPNLYSKPFFPQCIW